MSDLGPKDIWLPLVTNTLSQTSGALAQAPERSIACALPPSSATAPAHAAAARIVRLRLHDCIKFTPLIGAPDADRGRQRLTRAQVPRIFLIWIKRRTRPGPYR